MLHNVPKCRKMSHFSDMGGFWELLFKERVAALWAAICNIHSLTKEMQINISTFWNASS